MSTTLELEICGRSYKLAADEAQVPRLKALATKVNSYYATLEGQGLERDRLLVLLTLEMADSLLSTEQTHDTHQKTVDSFLNNIADRLEKLAS